MPRRKRWTIFAIAKNKGENTIKIKEVSLKRIFNLGNYENIQVGFVAAVEEDEDRQKVLKVMNREAKKYRESLEAKL